MMLKQKLFSASLRNRSSSYLMIWDKFQQKLCFPDLGFRIEEPIVIVVFVQTNIFRCIFQFLTRWAYFLTIIFGNVHRTARKLSAMSVFRRFSHFSHVRCQFSVSNPAWFLFSSLRRVDWALNQCSNRKFEKLLTNMWTREIRSFVKSHVRHLFQRPR